MFTGIIEDVGAVKSIEKKGPSGRITVEANVSLKDVKLGDSISINGICLTVTGLSGASFVADLSGETMRVTNLGELKPGSRVNLEFALTLSKPLGGHLVSGHIDGVGQIRRKSAKGESMDIEFAVPEELMGQVVKKGSVAVDGISLTVADLIPGGFKVAVIPHTLKKTTLLSRPEGSRVNIETDIIGKYVEKFFTASRGGSITEGFLSDHGFLRKR